MLGGKNKERALMESNQPVQKTTPMVGVMIKVRVCNFH